MQGASSTSKVQFHKRNQSILDWNQCLLCNMLWKFNCKTEYYHISVERTCDSQPIRSSRRNIILKRKKKYDLMVSDEFRVWHFKRIRRQKNFFCLRKQQVIEIVATAYSGGRCRNRIWKMSWMLRRGIYFAKLQFAFVLWSESDE